MYKLMQVLGLKIKLSVFANCTEILLIPLNIYTTASWGTYPRTPTLRGHPPQERSCFENNESKFGQITASIIASKSKYFFMRQPCRNRSAATAACAEQPE